MILTLAITAITIASISNACMDVIDFKFYDSVFSKLKNQGFWNPVLSWKNKWRNGDPTQGEKFPLSSTALVFTTDGWHLFKSIYLNLFSVGFILMGAFVVGKSIVVSIPILLGSLIYYKILFEITYKRLT